MSDAGESSNIKESFEGDETKVDIELTSVNLDCVKNEPNEETIDFKKDDDTEQYRITLEYKLKIEEDYDNLIGFLDNDVIMANTMIKLEAVKEEDKGSFNNFHCSKCKRIYKGYCLQCSSLLHILNNSAFVNFESVPYNIPTDILEIRETPRGKGVYLLKTLPMNVIFGPFESVVGIESTVGHSWKIIDNKLRNVKSGHWMKNIDCAASVSLKNLEIFQIDGNLYFQTNREITEGEELLIYYNNEELQQFDNSEEWVYTPQKHEKLPKIFACTVCCLGFGSNKCLMEHKRKCCQMEHSRTMKDFVLIECHYCKMWMEKWEHGEYHVAYCFEKHHRMWTDRCGDADVEEMEGGCGTKDGKRTYRRDICSRPKDRTDNLESDAKDYQSFSGANHETRLNECGALAERSNNAQIQNAVETNTKTRFHNHLNKHRTITKECQCDICMMKFTMKVNLKAHIKYKHPDDRSVKNYKCLECFYQTNSKSDFQKHLNKHRAIKPFKCDICLMKFTQKCNLRRHIKNKHTDDGSVKDYKCSECSYQTNFKGNLQNHLLKHTGIKAFTCDICLMKFTLKGSLKTHIMNKHRVDRSVKDHKCLECSLATNNKYYLPKHLNKHRGIKAFKCDICMKEFTEEDNLKRYIKSKHTYDASGKDYKCSECSYQTNYKSVLQRHLNTHRGITFQCNICMMKFTRKDNLATHIKNKHAHDGSVKY